MSDNKSSAAVGLATFAGVMLAVTGIFHFIAGLVAVMEDDFYVVTQKWVFEFNPTTWGWIHVVAGLVLIASGLWIFTGNVLARTVGVIAAAGSAVANFAWLPYYPIWSTIIIAIDVFIIWALTAHGRDITKV